jgi:hypothetical protein
MGYAVDFAALKAELPISKVLDMLDIKHLNI